MAWDKVYLEEKKNNLASALSPSCKMPTLWDFFHKSDEKQNSAHYKSYCKDCLDEELARIPIPDVNLDPAEQVLAGQDTFR